MVVIYSDIYYQLFIGIKYFYIEWQYYAESWLLLTVQNDQTKL